MMPVFCVVLVVKPTFFAMDKHLAAHLDQFLSLLQSHPNGAAHYYKDTFEKQGISPEMLDNLTSILHANGHADIKPLLSGTFAAHITTKGKAFLANGGYTLQQKKGRRQDKISKSTLHKNTLDIAKTLLFIVSLIINLLYFFGVITWNLKEVLTRLNNPPERIFFAG